MNVQIYCVPEFQSRKTIIEVRIILRDNIDNSKFQQALNKIQSRHNQIKKKKFVTQFSKSKFTGKLNLV